MPVIKAETHIQPRAFSLQDIERHARTLVHNARRQAEEIIQTARAEAEQLHAQARQAGLTDGRDEGLRKGLEQGRTAGHQQALQESKAGLAQLVKTLNTAAGQLNASLLSLEAQAHREVAELALAAARRITHRIACVDPQVLGDNLRQAVKLVVSANELTVYIHPSDRQRLAASLDELRLSMPQLQHVHIAEDATISPGGCRLTTARGLIDADLDAQFDRLAEQLFPSSPAEPAGAPEPRA